MMKMFNIKGIIVLAVILAVIQLVVGLVISPFLTPVIVDTLNEYADARISVSKVAVWPITLSVSLKDLKVFDPDNEAERIAFIPAASLRLSPLGLLSGRLVISKLKISNAEITLKGEPDGSFNVEKLAGTSEKKPGSIFSFFDRFKKGKDWFGRIYDAVKNSSSEEAIKKKEARGEGRVERDIVELPRGRKVWFVKPSDNYVFEIKDLAISNALFNLVADTGQTVQAEGVSFHIGNLGLDPSAGMRFDRISAKGTLKKDNEVSGRFNMAYAQSYRPGRQSITCKFSADDVDLEAVKFIYQDSLPVAFESGAISINSNTKILNGDLDSINSLALTGHDVVPKNRGQIVGFLPMPVVCDALNKIDPLKMKFEITGTVDKPQFRGFEDILLDIIKPYTADAAEGFKKQGLDALSNFFNKK